MVWCPPQCSCPRMSFAIHRRQLSCTARFCWLPALWQILVLYLSSVALIGCHHYILCLHCKLFQPKLILTFVDPYFRPVFLKLAFPLYPYSPVFTTSFPFSSHVPNDQLSCYSLPSSRPKPQSASSSFVSPIWLSSVTSGLKSHNASVKNQYLLPTTGDGHGKVIEFGFLHRSHF